MSIPAEAIRLEAAQLSQTDHSAFAADVRAGLGGVGQKTLPSSYLYDAVGSALFDVITNLPEYGVTRAEERVLNAQIGRIAGLLDEEARMSNMPLRVVELGSGSGRKTRLILETLARNRPLTYCPIDISPAALVACCRSLADIPGVSIEPYAGDYQQGLSAIRQRRRAGEQVVVLFLGSTIGNFAHLGAARFLGSVRNSLNAGDALLLGADLLKPVDTLIHAYDDEIGVTAAFDLNLLSRINRELGGDFDLTGFRHEARFNEQARSVEMHLLALRDQTARVPGADLQVNFVQGETIWTESSHKYTAEGIVQMGREARFGTLGQWSDESWPFADTLMRAH